MVLFFMVYDRDRNASVRGRKGYIRGRNGEDGEARGKAVIKHTGANRRCLCYDYRGKGGDK